MLNPLATIAAPTGILTAITKQLAAIQPVPGTNPITTNAPAGNPASWHSALLASYGLTELDWTNLQTALGGVNATNLLKLLNGTGLVLVVAAAPYSSVPPDASPAGVRLWSTFGDLT